MELLTKALETNSDKTINKQVALKLGTKKRRTRAESTRLIDCLKVCLKEWKLTRNI